MSDSLQQHCIHASGIMHRAAGLLRAISITIAATALLLPALAAQAQTVTATAPTLALSLSSATASLGQNVTLTAKVVGGYLPSGLVTFSSGSGPLGTANVNGGAATFSINNLADSLTQVADPRNLATTYSPNGLGNVTSQKC